MEQVWEGDTKFGFEHNKDVEEAVRCRSLVDRRERSGLEIYKFESVST